MRVLLSKPGKQVMSLPHQTLDQAGSCHALASPVVNQLCASAQQFSLGSVVLQDLRYHSGVRYKLNSGVHVAGVTLVV